MNKLPVSIQQIIVAAVIIAVIVGIVVALRTSELPVTETPTSGTPTTAESPPPQATSGTPVSKPTAPPSAPKVPAPTVQSGITLLTPQQGDLWAINRLHQIHWNRESGVVGGIQLINAQSQEVAGWILANTTAKQTSFSWDTRDISINRLGGAKTNLKPGTYRVKIVFDQKFAPVESAPFTIRDEGEQEIITPVVRFKNETITPGVLTVSHGTKVMFVNNDTATHRISSKTMPAFTLLSNGGAYTLDTSVLTADTHYYLSDIYSFRAQGTLIVK